MTYRIVWGISVLALTGLVLVSLVFVLTATNTVPSSRAGHSSRPIAANDLKPPECSAITLTNKVAGSGTINGTGAGDLVAGSAGIDTMNGRNGSDCILGGGGDDSIDGAGGTDVCNGGPGTDAFIRCETVIQ